MIDTVAGENRPALSVGRKEVRRFATLVRREWQMTLRDPVVVFLILATPVILLLLLGQPLSELYLRYAPSGSRAGAYAVFGPRAAMMFAFFGVAIVTFSFFRERWFGYTELLESWPVRRSTIITAKLAVPWLLVFVQFILLSTIPAALDGGGSASAILIVATAVVTATWVTTLGMITLNFTTTSGQSTQLSNLVVMLGGIAGGLLVPVQSLAEPLQVIARSFPQYWIARGFDNGSGHIGGWMWIDVWLVVAAIVLLAVSSYRLDLKRFRSL